MDKAAKKSADGGELSVRCMIGDIAKQKCDAVVNAANVHLQSGSGVCGALFAGAGSHLQSACDDVLERLGRNLNVSEAVITPGFDLPSQWIIHAVAPSCMGRWDDTIKAQMEETYRSIFRIADQYGVTTIAVPAMGLGVYRCDPQKSTRCVYDAVEEYAQLPERKINSILFVLHSERLLELYRSLFAHSPHY